MISAAELDKNFHVSHTIDPALKENLHFHDIDQSPFAIYGIYREDNTYVRMPGAIANTVNECVRELYRCTAGGRVRFITDSRKIAIRALTPCPDGGFVYFAPSGERALDLYAEEDGVQRYYGTYCPPLRHDGGFEAIIDLQEARRRTITIHMPLYNTVRNLFVGLEQDAVLEPAPPIPGPPVVYYGSSITQGGCATRPGGCYQAMVHHQLNIDYINLGFSGGARGEDSILDYISGLTMSAFVYDYDYNAPTPEHLRNTHYHGYRRIRDTHPEIPIILMSRPKYHLTEDEWERHAIVRETYERALAEGDTNIYYLDGRELLDASIREYGLVDNVHPNDLGFRSMSNKLLPLLKQLLNQ